MLLDKIICETDKILKTLLTKPTTRRLYPDQDISEAELSENERKKVIGLMRVNHTGEICAQALYQGQALTARNKEHQKEFNDAAYEEEEHLAWTKKRIDELGGKTSILNPLFYLSSLSLGILAGMCGDKWNLGFLEETEKQVEKHIASHIELLPILDKKSKAILEQMKIDEIKHGEMAHDSGATELPFIVKKLMVLSSKIMTKTTYYL
ncbi:MAG: 2-polyprenyl-3-methyl-6-methoxy-1,4-benzoquinone monooxygenase [Bacteroidia bacterium]|nr:MAG: 2-polyprenyl-3-methyl-6-methoxy-1,4-benzoquinone monooxygenase [Bacteroidia bacterium]